MKTLSSIRKNTYFDSVTLMGLSKKLLEVPSISSVSVSMGTEMNKRVLIDGGFDASALTEAGPNDLMIACSYEDDASEEEVCQVIESALTKQVDSSSHDAEQPRTLVRGAQELSANLAIISVPGIYAAAEARKALQAGLHVLLFSDNVSIEDEVALKAEAHEKGLLVMGPDCGTSAFQGVGLCFANAVRRGGIGIVSASGTGAQEASVLIDAAGMGVSHIIGTGGRDVSQEVGGRMFLDALDALEADEATTHILLVSKPPHKSVAAAIRDRIKTVKKPLVGCFLGEEAEAVSDTASFVSDIPAAVRALGAQCKLQALDAEDGPTVPEHELTGRYVRGLFCGGTLMEEAKLAFMKEIPDVPVYANTTKGGSLSLEDISVSQNNTFLDMGDDYFTRGKPHPMIEPETRNARLIQESLDPDTAIVLFDVVLGYGAHENPAEVVLSAVRTARAMCAEEGRSPLFVAVVLGTDHDPQQVQRQVEMLEQENIVICNSAVSAALLCAALVKELD